MRLVFAFALTPVLALIIACLTLGPSGSGPPPMPHFDKVAHVVAFACLAFPLGFARPDRAFWIFLAGLTYGALIEVIQPNFSRTADWADLLSNTVGLVLGLAIARLASRGLHSR